jgi:DNA-binding MarR family transcriptional regulator
MMAPAPTPARIETPEVDRDLVVRLRLAIARLGRRLRQQTGEEITYSQLSALGSIEKRGPLTLGALAAIEQVRPPSITRIVANLEEAGLVTRRADPGDRRIVRAEVTPAGRELLRRGRIRKDAYLAARLSALSPEDIELLRQAASILERLLEVDLG